MLGVSASSRRVALQLFINLAALMRVQEVMHHRPTIAAMSLSTEASEADQKTETNPCDSCGLNAAACLMGVGSHGQWCMDTECNVCCNLKAYLPTVRYTLSFAQSLHLHVWLCWANGVEKLHSNNVSCALYTDR